MSFDDFKKHFTDFEMCSVSIDDLYEDENSKQCYHSLSRSQYTLSLLSHYWDNGFDLTIILAFYHFFQEQMEHNYRHGYLVFHILLLIFLN